PGDLHPRVVHQRRARTAADDALAAESPRRADEHDGGGLRGLRRRLAARLHRHVLRADGRGVPRDDPAPLDQGGRLMTQTTGTPSVQSVNPLHLIWRVFYGMANQFTQVVGLTPFQLVLGALGLVLVIIV